LWKEQLENGNFVPFYSISIDGTVVRTVQPSYKLGLRYAYFDPLQFVPSVDPQLRANSDTNLYIVQFVTQPLEEFKDAIVALGGEVYHYIAQFAYLVEMDKNIKKKVEDLPYVRWIGPYHPAYRLEEFMIEHLNTTSTEYPFQKYNIQVVAVDKKPIVSERILSQGWVLNRADAGKYVVEATLTPEQLFEVARWDEVLFIDRWSPYEADMNIAREIGGANYLETVAGYTGEGVRGEVFDVGFNLNHVDFTAHPLLVHGDPVTVHNHGASTSGQLWSFITQDEDDSNGDDNGNGGSNNGNGENEPPIAESGGPYSGTPGEEITFDGTGSYDPEETDLHYQWDFDGDEEFDTDWLTSSTVTHAYYEPGVYTVILKVRDIEGLTDTNVTTVTIAVPNNPPTSPEITGETMGSIHIEYKYTALSTDADNDTLQYRFDWGDDSGKTTTDFVENGTMIEQKHTWEAAGRYVLSVKAYDNETFSDETYLAVYIDAIKVEDIGYLTDEDSDGVYDIFHNIELIIETTSEQNDRGQYLLDCNGDGTWDYTFDIATGLSSYQEENPGKTPGFEVIIVLVALTSLLLFVQFQKKIWR
jgi:hypothetical protein